MKKVLVLVSLFTLLSAPVFACGFCNINQRCVSSTLPFWCVSACDSQGCTCIMGGGCEGGIFWRMKPGGRVTPTAQRLMNKIDKVKTMDELRSVVTSEGLVLNEPATDHASKSWGRLKVIYR